MPSLIDSSPEVEPKSLNEPLIPSIDEQKLKLLKSRQDEYKKAALVWKKSGNQEEALKLMMIIKRFDTVIKAVSEGDTIDLSDMPPPPTLPNVQNTNEGILEKNKEENSSQKSCAESIEPGNFFLGFYEIRLEIFFIKIKYL